MHKTPPLHLLPSEPIASESVQNKALQFGLLLCTKANMFLLKNITLHPLFFAMLLNFLNKPLFLGWPIDYKQACIKLHRYICCPVSQLLLLCTKANMFGATDPTHVYCLIMRIVVLIWNTWKIKVFFVKNT